MLCRFLLYINMNQPQVYICPLSPEPPPICLPILGCPRAMGWVPVSHSKFPPAICFTLVVCMFLCCPLNLPHPLFPPLCPQVCSLCLHLRCYPGNRFISIIFLDSNIWNTIFFFLFIISLCIVGSRFTHLGGRSPGERKGHPLQYSSLENSMDCIVHGVTKSRTWPSFLHFHPPH